MPTERLPPSAGRAVSAVVIGAGPAGLTCGYELTRNGVRVVVAEAGSLPGGLARTEEYRGFRFDIGGHRFFTKIEVVDRLWHELLGDDFLRRPRLSRIFYRRHFFKYPLEIANVVAGLGFWNTTASLLSYLRARLFPRRPELTLDVWLTNRFGRRLFKAFFESYTEKVWGMRCHEIDADWAAQRIRGLDVVAIIKHTLLRRRNDKRKTITTLIEEFHYPRLGPGMMWEACTNRIERLGGTVAYGKRIARLHWLPGRLTSAEAADGTVFEGAHFISTMPIRDLFAALDPPPPQAVADAARALRYRDFITVALIVNQANVFPDNWIYIHDPTVHVGRIQNFKNWSPEMVPSPAATCLGLEYFCSQGDHLWQMSDDQLRALGATELQHLGLCRADAVLDGAVLRVPDAYPVYDDRHKQSLAVIREFLTQLPNLQLIGRNGMHHYNNQDHSMLTGIMAAQNILGAANDLWAVNAGGEYHEG